MMYPILYSKNEEPTTGGNSYDLGLGVLDEAREIEVVEELNGAFTLTLLYPVTGRLYNSIERGCLLMCKSNPYSDPQLFRIQQITRPMNGIIEIYAPHKSYDLSGYVLKPCSYSNVASLFAGMNSKLIGQTPIPWSWWTNMSTSKDFVLSAPISVRSALAGNDTSVLKTYGGEFEFDNNTIKLHNNRGINRGVTIRYGHNLIDFKQEELFEQCYTDVYPYWTKEVYDESASTTDNPVYRRVTIMPEEPIATRSGWSEITMPEEEATWESVCFGDGKFVAVAYDSDIAGVSTDGIHWTISILPENAGWCSVCYGEGVFVAIPRGENFAAYSRDGITWIKRRLPSTQSWSAVCYGNGRFVAISFNSTVAAYSLDGTSWMSTNPLPSSNSWDSICYGHNKFVALSYGSSNTKVAYSPNGMTWTEASIPNGIWHSVCYGNEKFIAVGFNSNKVLSSNDGITWTEHACLPRSSTWYATCYGNGNFVTLDHEHIATSSTGLSWTESSLPSYQTWVSVCYGKEKFVAVSEEGKTISTTPSERKHILPLDLSSYAFDSDSDSDSNDNSVLLTSNAPAPLMAGNSSYEGEISCGEISYAYNSSYPYQGKVECVVTGKSSGTYSIKVNGIVKCTVTSNSTYSITLDNLYDGSTSSSYTVNLCDPNGNTVDSFIVYHERKTGVSLDCTVGDSSVQCRIVDMDSAHAYSRRIVFTLYPGGVTYTVFTQPYATTSDYVTFYNLSHNAEYEIKYSIQSESGGTEYASGYKAVKINAEDPTPEPVPTSEDTSDYIPTVEELVEAAQEYIIEHKIGLPEVKMTVNFIDLSKTTEYKNLSSQTIKLGDTINVVFDKYGINTTAEVIKTTYDPLKDSYSEIELGNQVDDFASTIRDIATPKFEEVEGTVSNTKNEFEQAISHATEMITTAHGGQVILHASDDSGKPNELLILSRNDNVPPTLENATHVWRWNKNGLGHSSRGYEGPYGDVAITKDGHIVADTIVFREGYVTGTLGAGNITTSGLTADHIEVKDNDNNILFKADKDTKSVLMSSACITGTITADEVSADDISAGTISAGSDTDKIKLQGSFEVLDNEGHTAGEMGGFASGNITYLRVAEANGVSSLLLTSNNVGDERGIMGMAQMSGYNIQFSAGISLRENTGMLSSNRGSYGSTYPDNPMEGQLFFYIPS